MAVASGALLPSQTPAVAQSPESPPLVEAASDEPVPTGGDPAEVLSSEDEAAIAGAIATDTAASGGAPASAPDSGGAESSGSSGVYSFNPDLSFIFDMAAAAFSDEDHLQTGGHDPTRTGFNLQQLELAVGAAVDPYFRFDSNIVLTLEEIEIEEAYGTTLDLPGGLQARLGQFLTRFGRLNPTHPHTWCGSDTRPTRPAVKRTFST
jgi:hypothetical protein